MVNKRPTESTTNVHVNKGTPSMHMQIHGYARIGRTATPYQQANCAQGCHPEPLVGISKPLIHFLSFIPCHMDESVD